MGLSAVNPYVGLIFGWIATVIVCCCVTRPQLVDAMDKELNEFLTIANKLKKTDPTWVSNDAEHGNVKMGSFTGCDDGQSNLSVDWDGDVGRYACKTPWSNDDQVTTINETCSTEHLKPLHICMRSPIYFVEDLPTSGPHRPAWPVYGEYRYIPPQRWLHSLEHGAVVFLYNSCADPDEVAKLRTIADRCLRRRIISPHQNLTEAQPFAVLSYSCKLIMSHVDEARVTNFIKNHALNGREHRADNGQYHFQIIDPSPDSVPGSDFEDSHLCPESDIEQS